MYVPLLAPEGAAGGSAAPAPAAPATPAAPAPGKVEPAKTAPAGKAEPVVPGKEAPKVADPTNPERQPGETKEQHQSRKLKLKFQGKEQELEEAEVVRLAQLGLLGRHKASENAQLKQREAEISRLIKDDPWGLLEKVGGHDRRKLAEELLADIIKTEGMTPEQKKAAEMEKRLAEYAEKERQDQERQSQERDQRVAEQMGRQMENDFIGAIKTSGLPASKTTMARMAFYMDQALREGLDVDPKDVVHLVKADFEREARDLFSNLEPEALIAILGEGVAEKIRAHAVAKANVLPTVARPAVTPVAPQKTEGGSWKDRKSLAERNREERQRLQSIARGGK